MSDHVTREEFTAMDNRLRILEGEVNGEKAVTRHVLGQVRLNADDIAIVRRINDQTALNGAALASHGNLLNVMRQDVIAIRQDATALRRGQEEIRARIDAFAQRADARFDAADAKFDAIDARFDAIDARFDAVMEAIRALRG